MNISVEDLNGLELDWPISQVPFTVSLNLFDSLEDDAEDDEEDEEDEQTDEADADGDDSRWPVLAVAVAAVIVDVVSSWILLELLLLEWLDSYY